MKNKYFSKILIMTLLVTWSYVITSSQLLAQEVLYKVILDYGNSFFRNTMFDSMSASSDFYMEKNGESLLVIKKTFTKGFKKYEAEMLLSIAKEKSSQYLANGYVEMAQDNTNQSTAYSTIFDFENETIRNYFFGVYEDGKQTGKFDFNFAKEGKVSILISKTKELGFTEQEAQMLIKSMKENAKDFVKRGYYRPH